MMTIEFATLDDVDTILDYDQHVALSEIDRLIENKRYPWLFISFSQNVSN